MINAIMQYHDHDPESNPDKLELGCGVSPTPGYLHHDRIKHAPHVDVAFDLRNYPWPVEDNSLEEVMALDVFEHVTVEIEPWLNECWRVLKVNGLLQLRLPSWDNERSYRDPTHLRVFHSETFDYWDREKNLHKEFGSFYFAESARWWKVESVERENGDWRFRLRKRV